MTTYTNISIPDHKFNVGDTVAHQDDPTTVLTVEELTLRVWRGEAAPTYTLADELGNGWDDVEGGDLVEV